MFVARFAIDNGLLRSSPEGLKITSFYKQLPWHWGWSSHQLMPWCNLQVTTVGSCWPQWIPFGRPFFGDPAILSRAKQLRSISTSSWRFQLGDGYSMCPVFPAVFLLRAKSILIEGQCCAGQSWELQIRTASWFQISWVSVVEAAWFADRVKQITGTFRLHKIGWFWKILKGVAVGAGCSLAIDIPLKHGILHYFLASHPCGSYYGEASPSPIVWRLWAPPTPNLMLNHHLH